jgi:TolB-like protein
MPNPDMSANPDPLSGKRLDSWKEIATFLGRAERTVKRWETERGLPVHRVPGGGRSAVFAFQDELAEWLKGRAHELEADDSASGDVEDRQSHSAGVDAAQATAVLSPTLATKSWPASRLAAWLVPLVLVAALVVAFTTAHHPFRFKSQSPPSSAQAKDLDLSPDSIAVLPFINVRGDARTDYLSDGITESLMANLAHIPQLKVRSRDSVFRYKGKDTDVRTIGSQLGVSALVSGRVMVQGDVVEISAELTDVRDNTEIWGRHYRGKSAELVSLQQQIAGDIAGTLRSALSSAARQQVTNQGTEDAEAYTLYLKGRYCWNKRTLVDLMTAVSYYNQAIAKDPNYALAYSGIADVYSVVHFFGINPRQAFPKSNAAARKALELDPTLAHPHAVLGQNEMEYDWDFASGESEFKKAIELDPNDATAHQWYAEKLSAIGRHPEAIAEIKRAHELDPQSPVVTRVLGGILNYAGQYDQGIPICKQLTKDNPTFAIAHDCLFFAYWDKHMYPQAVEELNAYGRLSGIPAVIENAAALEHGFHNGGWPQALTEVIAVYENRRKTSYASPFEIARLYADRGDKEKAFDWLDTALREHDSLLIGIRPDPQFNSIRSDPRFDELTSKIGLPKLQ